MQPVAPTVASAMSAGLLRRVVDMGQLYRPPISGLGADELVEAGRGRLVVDGDHVATVPGPRDAERVECGTEQIADVGGVVGEVVADARNTPIVGDDPSAVAVDEAADEVFGGRVDVGLLPGFQHDGAEVFAA